MFKKKNSKVYKGTVKYAQWNKSTQTPWKRPDGRSFRQGLQKNCLKNDQRTTEDMEKVKKMIHEQNGNINKETENLKRS